MLFILLNKKLIKLTEQIKAIIVQKIVIISMEVFPKKKLIEHYDFAYKYLNEVLSDNEDTDEISNEDIELKEILKNNDYINDYFSKMYLLRAYLLQRFPSLLLDRYKDKENEFMKKSIEFNSSVIKLDKTTYLELVQKIRTDQKTLASEMKSIGAKIIARERKDYIEPLNISIQNITIILSLMSTAFIIGGYIYISTLLNYFSVDVSYYYSIVDYLSSSVSIIPSILLTTVCGIFFFFLGMFDAINNQIINDELDIKQKNDILLIIYMILILVTVYLIINFYAFDKIDYSSMQILGLIVIFIIISKININEFIKNSRTVILMIFTSYIFFSLLLVKSYDKISSIESGEYKSNYSIKFIPEYKEFEAMSLITMNSNYLFMWSQDKKQVLIIPSSSIKFIKVLSEK